MPEKRNVCKKKLKTNNTRRTYTQLKSTTETPEKVSNMFKVNNKNTRLLLTLDIFHTFS